MAEDHFIELMDVTKTYHQGENPVVALDHIHLSLSKGGFIAITGKSGCGKSTLINILGGLDSPDQGRVMIQGEDISRMDDRRLTLFRRDRVGIIFQFFNLLPILNLEENIALPYLLREGSNPRRLKWSASFKKWASGRDGIIIPTNYPAERCNGWPFAGP